MISRRGLVHGGEAILVAAIVVIVAVLYRSSPWSGANGDTPGGVSTIPLEAVAGWPDGFGPGEGSNIGPLRCRLLSMPPPTPAYKERQPELRYELINVSNATVNIPYHTYPHFHTSFLVRDGAGKVVSSFYYHTLSSFKGLGANSSLPVWTFQPGEPYVWHTYLWILQEYCRPRLAAGKYRIEAVFHNGAIRARSGQVGIVISPDNGKGGQLIWRLDSGSVGH